MSNSFSQKVYQLAKKVPSGKVTTYKQIGQALNSQAYQAVGQALKNNPSPPIIPCHRVVKNNGQIGGFCGQNKGKAVKRKVKLLKKEGIKFEPLKTKKTTKNNCQETKEKRIKNFEKVLFKF